MNNNELKLQLVQNYIKEKENKLSENTSLILNAISCILGGFMQFDFKYIKLFYSENYSTNTLCFYRYIFSLLFNYIIIYYTESYKKQKKFIELIEYKWIWIRGIAQFLVFQTFLFMLEYFRTSTCSCWTSMAPISILILSTFFLKEKFYMRYLYGILICFFGVFLMIKNEDNNYQGKNNDNNEIIKILKGTFWGFFQLITIGFQRVSNKKLLKQNILQDDQLIFSSILNIILAFICSKIRNEYFSFNIIYIFNCSINGLLWLSFNRLYIISLKNIALSKTTSIGYISMVTVFILGVIVLNEKVFISDIIGSLLILGFNVYNSLYPIKENQS